MDNPEKVTKLGTQDTRRRQTKLKMCWTSFYANKHK